MNAKKYKEWNAIENIIPTIEETLHMEIVKYDNRYAHESPDFIFYNGGYSIGIEVVECHPSVQINKRNNAPRMKSKEFDICEGFLDNEYLKSITVNEKYNIIIDRGYELNIHVPLNEIYNSIECHLRAWRNNQKNSDVKLIRRIRVIPTKGKNIVQFNNLSRRDPIKHYELKKSISDKNNKLKFYSKESVCDEYWLCVFLPFEENRQSNCIDFENEQNDFEELLKNCKYNRICVTSVMPNDIIWLKI